jgi:hypothetical protein
VNALARIRGRQRGEIGWRVPTPTCGRTLSRVRRPAALLDVPEVNQVRGNRVAIEVLTGDATGEGCAPGEHGNGLGANTTDHAGAFPTPSATGPDATARPQGCGGQCRAPSRLKTVAAP